ncbi:hypothetical protein HPB47_001348 [Ixodes persulcatus]|uniref:Uncharacterized protein n=1 Tax=Ixodes persulcatus TaxID=34615 RepID=A0AC60PPL9_IXOPE|nr:hypothetical protein HPB47_001348 [Ixodes persulcatus]
MCLFSVPKDSATRNLWEKNLQRSDKRLEESSAVCELHFEPRFILRDDVHIIGGKEVRIPCGHPSLMPDAVPTLLPSVPKDGYKQVFQGHKFKCTGDRTTRLDLVRTTAAGRLGGEAGAAEVPLVSQEKEQANPDSGTHDLTTSSVSLELLLDGQISCVEECGSTDSLVPDSHQLSDLPLALRELPRQKAAEREL